MEGLLGAAQNVEEKWLSPLCGISGLMDGSGQFGEACAWRGQTPQAGQGWFIRVPLEGAHSSVQQLLVGISFLTCETPIKLYHLYSLWLREAFAGYIPRKGYAVTTLSGRVSFGEDVVLLLYPAKLPACETFPCPPTRAFPV